MSNNQLMTKNTVLIGFYFKKESKPHGILFEMLNLQKTVFMVKTKLSSCVWRRLILFVNTRKNGLLFRCNQTKTVFKTGRQRTKESVDRVTQSYDPRLNQRRKILQSNCRTYWTVAEVTCLQSAQSLGNLDCTVQKRSNWKGERSLCKSVEHSWY